MAGWLHGVCVGECLFVFPLCSYQRVKGRSHVFPLCGFSLSLFCNYTAVDLLLACMYVCMYACMLACILQMPAEQCQLVADTALYMHVRVACSLHSSKHPCTHAPMLEGVRSPW